MKQAILYGARDLRIEDTSLDCENLQSDQLYAETIVSALSTGTDLGNYLGDSTYVPGAPDYPRRIGYSNVAVVRQAGTDVSRPKVGQRVFSTQPHLSAYVARQSDILVTVPEAVSSEQASLAYLTHLGLAALRQANYLPGENVAIVVRRNLEYILDLMASEALRLESLITHRLPVARMKEAYELACQHSKEMVGAVFQWS